MLVAPKKDRLRRPRLPTARMLRVGCGEHGTFPSMAACRNDSAIVAGAEGRGGAAFPDADFAVLNG
jgi:hypothetical protein